MRPDHLEKLNLWFTEQLAALKAEGASEQGLKAGDVADLALRRIFEEHFNEIDTDEVFIEEAFAAVSEKTFPEDLRQLAIQARTLGNLEIGPYLDLIANCREEQDV